MFFKKSDQQKRIICHYIGDDSIVCATTSHGNKLDQSIVNGKSNQIGFNPTSKDVKQQIEALIPTNLNDNQISSKIKSDQFNQSDFQMISLQLSRNLKQIQYHRLKLNNKLRVFNNDVQDLHYLILNGYSSFIKQFSTHPQIEVYLADNQVLELANIPLMKKEDKIITYDTTFKMCKFYVSIICMKNTDLINEPIFPVMFFVHERKFFKTHKKFGQISS